MAAVLVAMEEEAEAEGPEFVPRIIRDRRNPLDYLNDDELRQQYRLTRECIFDLCELLQDDLRRPTNRSRALPVHLQVTTALRLLASGSFQGVTGDTTGLSQPSVSKLLRSFTVALCRHRRQFINFPEDAESIRTVKERFYEMSRMPNVLGAVDGSLIPIKAPSPETEHNFICRKGFHCMNVQAVCNADLLFTNVVVKFPGRTHDAYIWSQCELNQQLQNGHYGDGWVLGDSAYPLRPWLMTPILNAQSRAEERYNRAQKVARSTVERAFGILKSRFRCLHKTGGCLTLSPERCCKVIMSCFILHNICIKNNIPLDENVDINENEEAEIALDDAVIGVIQDGGDTRARLIRERFTY